MFGLFAGFSALSLVEVIYYFFIRVGYNIYNQRQRKKVEPIIISNHSKRKDAKIVKDIVKEYLSESSIHGLNAYGSKKLIMKNLDILMLNNLNFLFSIGIYQELYIKFKYFPIVMTLNAESTDIQSV